jgi:hypothetical protein
MDRFDEAWRGITGRLEAVPESLRSMARWRVVPGYPHEQPQKAQASRAAGHAAAALPAALDTFYADRQWAVDLPAVRDAGAWFDLRESDGLQVIRMAFGFAYLTRLAMRLGSYAEADATFNAVNIWVRYAGDVKVPPNPWWLTSQRSGLCRMTGHRIDGCPSTIVPLSEADARILCGRLMP